MYFVLVREPRNGKIVHQEILDAGDADRPFDDPFWAQAARTVRLLKATYSGAQVIEGMGSSIADFLRDHPEYGETAS